MSSPERYKTIKSLYKGPSMRIYLTQAESTKQYYQLKAIDITTIDRDKQEKMCEDGKLLEKLLHPCIVKCKEVYKLKKSNICIVTEHIKGIDLFQKLQEHKAQPLPEHQVMEWFVQMLLGLSYCHNEGVLHYNLNSKSVLFTEEGYIKIGGFEIGSTLSTAVHINNTLVHESHYFAPEIIKGQAYTSKSDVWSLGVLLYEMCSLKFPFIDRSLMGLALKIGKGIFDPIQRYYSTDIKEIINNMLTVEANARPTLNHLLGTTVLIMIENKFVRENVGLFLDKVKDKEEYAILCKQWTANLSTEKSREVKPNLKIRVIKLAKKKPPVIRGKCIYNKTQVLKRIKSEDCTQNYFADIESNGSTTLNKEGNEDIRLQRVIKTKEEKVAIIEENKDSDNNKIKTEAKDENEGRKLSVNLMINLK